MDRKLAAVLVLSAVAVATGCSSRNIAAPGSNAATGPADRTALIVKNFAESVDAQRAAGAKFNGDQMKMLSDAALAGFSPETLSADEIETLYNGKLLIYSRWQPQALDRLALLAANPDVEGAKAACNRLLFLRTNLSKTEQQAEALTTALRHPALGEAIATGGCSTLFRCMRDAKPESLQPLKNDMLNLKPFITTKLPPQNARSLPGILDALMLVTDENDRATREPLRTACVASVKSATKRVPKDDEVLGKQMKTALVKLDGAYIRGQLVGYEAPDLAITWSNHEPAINSLKDLRGKVVVLDYWATWCGPCVGSFPEVRHLQEHYAGYPVEIVGVTSIQGRHVTPEHEVIDCKDDPAKEKGFMPEYIKQQDITWTIAYSEQDVFNPEYGIRGIPHVVIIDAKGVVRHRGLHPAGTPMAEKCAMIDELLKEAGLPAPPPPTEPQASEAGAAAGQVNPG